MKCNKLVDAGRRQFLRGGAVAGVGAAATMMTGVQAQAATPGAQVDYPSTKLANIADLAVNDPVDIEFPDADSPGILLKMGEAVEGGGLALKPTRREPCRRSIAAAFDRPLSALRPIR